MFQTKGFADRVESPEGGNTYVWYLSFRGGDFILLGYDRKYSRETKNII
jgi:hypothetical protein